MVIWVRACSRRQVFTRLWSHSAIQAGWMLLTPLSCLPPPTKGHMQKDQAKYTNHQGILVPSEGTVWLLRRWKMASFLCFFYIVSFNNTEDRTQSLVHIRQVLCHWATTSTCFYFEIISLSFPGRPWTHYVAQVWPPASVSPVATKLGLYHHILPSTLSELSK